MTLRNQVDFVGSLAAQVAPLNSQFLEFILDSNDAFLDWRNLVDEIEKAIGSKNHLTLIFEDGLHSIVDQIQGFVFPSGMSTSNLTNHLISRVNVRQAQPGVWQSDVRAIDFALPVSLGRQLFNVTALAIGRPMARSLWRYFSTKLLGITKHQVQFSTREAEKLRRLYSTSNGELAQHLRMDLGSRGYY